MRVLVTGGKGMLGTHVRAHFEFHSRVCDAVECFDRQAFSDSEQLTAALSRSDVVIHCAGVNRASPDEVRHGNASIAKELAQSLKRSKFSGLVIYTNSTHSELENDYGIGKQEASDTLQAACNSLGCTYIDLVLPHVFGEFGRPNYNSVVHTFCHQLADKIPLSVNGDGQLELMHANQVARLIDDLIEKGFSGRYRASGFQISVRELAEKLTGFRDSYIAGIVPDVGKEIDLYLFNMLRDALFPNFYPVKLTLHEDNRGSLFEAEKNRCGGQTFLSTTKPGITRGNHFHFRKIERFLVIAGSARISLRPIYGSEVIHFEVSGENPMYIDMPALHTHKIENIGDSEVTTLFWSHEIFDPDRPDTYALEVES